LGVGEYLGEGVGVLVFLGVGESFGGGEEVNIGVGVGVVTTGRSEFELDQKYHPPARIIRTSAMMTIFFMF